MIFITIPSSRPKPKHVPKFYEVGNKPSVYTGELTIEQEIARRQDIIDDLLSTFVYVVGDRVVFQGEPLGEFTIRHIVKRYHEIKDDWPLSDNPLIISVQSDDLPKEYFHCTTNKIIGLASNKPSSLKATPPTRPLLK